MFDASPANIDARTRSETLPGGARYSFLAKSTRGAAVEANITLRIGSEAALQGRAAVAELTAAMLRRGTRSRSQQQINDQLDALKSTVSIGGSGQTVSIRVVSTRDRLRADPRLAADYEALKVELAARFAHSRAEYTAAKQAFIDAIADS